MNVPPDYQYNSDLLVFANNIRSKFISLLQNEIKQLGAIRVQFALKVKFLIERHNGVRETMSHYFQQNESYLYQDTNTNIIKTEFEKFIETMKGEIEVWSERGSSWILGKKIEEAYS